MSEENISVYIDAELEELIPGYLSNRANDIAAIREALESDDMDRIHILAHSMKGSGGGYGFDMISEIGSGLEDAAKKGEANLIEKQLNLLSDYLDRVNVVYIEE